MNFVDPVGTVLAAVAADADVTVAQLVGPSRRAPLVRARDRAAWILHRQGYSLSAVGRILGGRDHTTIFAAVRRHRAIMDANSEEAVRTSALVARLQSRPLRVVVEAPFAPTGGTGSIEGNREYARACFRDSLLRGEAPLWSPFLYAQGGVLDDADPDERRLGMLAGFAWGVVAERVVVYDDHGTTKGMQEGVDRYRAAGLEVEFRRLGMTP